MNILLDADPFNNAQANLKILDTFFSIKQRIMECLLPLAKDILLSEGNIIVILTPKNNGLRYDNMTGNLRIEIEKILKEKLDLSLIAENLTQTDLN